MVRRLPVDQAVARRHVDPAAAILLRVHGEPPVRESAARGAGRAVVVVVGLARRVGVCFAGVEVRYEDGVVVETFDIEGGEDGLLDHGGEGVAFVGGACVDEAEGRVGEVDGERVVGRGDCEVGIGCAGAGVGVWVCIWVGGRDDPVEGGLGVCGGGGVGDGGFALPAGRVGGAVCGDGVEEGGEGPGADGEGSAGAG